MNLSDFVLESGPPDAIAVVDEGGHHWTYAQVRSLVAHAAGYLEQATAPQDRCLIYADNSLFWLCACLATIRAGRIAVPIAPDCPFEHLQHALVEYSPRVVFVDWARCERLLRHERADCFVVCDGDEEREDVLEWEQISALLPSDGAFAADEGTTAMVALTGGGSSGRAHGAMLSHANMMASVRATAEHLRLRNTDRTCCAIGLSGVMGISAALAQLRMQGAVVLRPAGHSEAADLLSHAIRHAVTGLMVTADVLQELVDQTAFSTCSLPTLRYIEHVGSRPPAGLIAAVQQLFPNVAIHSMYGLAEAGGALAAVPSQLAVTKSAAIGEPLPGVELTIVDAFDHPQAQGDTGEIVASSKTIARGYWNEPELSRKVFHRGLLHTGDVGLLDADGQLHLTGKVSDLLRLGDASVSTSAIERPLAMFPGMRELAVLTRSDEILGDVVILVAVHPRGDEIRQQLLEYAAGKLPFSCRPREIHFRSHLPRNSAGQIDRSALQEQIGLEKHLLEPMTDQLQAPGQSLEA